MEQATLHIDMIKLIERLEPIAVIWQNCRVVKLTSKKKRPFLNGLFSMKRTLWCMKNEAELRSMKRGFATRRRLVCASLYVRLKHYLLSYVL